MDVSKILNKVLLERTSDATAKGIDYKDTGNVLANAKSKCPTLKFLGDVKQMTPTFPSVDNKPLLNKFKEIYDLRPEAVAYATGKVGTDNIVVFGIVDPATSSGQRGLYAYTIIQGQPAVYRKGGAGTGCSELQRIEDYGQVKLSDYNQKVLQGVIDRCKGKLVSVAEASKDPNFNMSNYKKIELKDLTDCVTGAVPQWDKGIAPDGYAWEQIAAGEVGFSNNAVNVSNIMKDQGFTSNQDDIINNPELLELGFYLKDVKADSAFTRIDPKLMNVPYWPLPNAGVVIDPTPDQCRNFVRKLKACKNNDKSVTLADCRKNLTQLKLSTVRCDKKGMFKAGGVLGLKDDFRSLLTGDTTNFGLSRLYANLGKVVAKESLNKKINKILNEEHSKFSFNQPKYEFDQVLVEELANQLVVNALFDLNKALTRMNRLNENATGSILGAFGDNMMDKLVGGGKEFLASKVISMLGFDETSYTALVFKNLFANLDFDQYGEFISNCPKFTKVIVKSALEAWLDYAMSKGLGKDKISGIVYMALKNMVTETAANTSVYLKLEKVAGNIVCPMVSGIADSIKSGDINPLS